MAGKRDGIKRENLRGPEFAHLGHFREPAIIAEGHNRTKGLSRSKACKILEDGEIGGKPLTKKQRGLFGARCSGEELRTQ